MKRNFTTWAAALALAAGLSVPGAAQDAGNAANQNPAQNPAPNQSQNRAVRLSTIEGQVRILQSGQSITDQAVANTPLFDGFGVQTGDDGRAELQFPDGTVGRIPPDSSVSLEGMQQGAGDFLLDHGMGYFELRGGESVRFAGYTAASTGAAVIRVKLDEAPGEIAVFDGAVHLEGPDGITADLHGGQSVRLAPSDSMLHVAELVEPDSWDAWNSDRDQALNTAAGSATPATKSMDDATNPAWGDLNQNGNWYDVPNEGYVWSPYDASNGSWDPYGIGYWMDSPGYGYTWVSGYSWGYLPYQCGLWNWYSGFGWGWAPGGCTPWWGGGVYAINVGRGPGGWHPPGRPLPPRRGPARPYGGIHAAAPQPIIAVHRNGPPLETGLPLRDRRTPVTIAGASVVPMRPVTVRPVYDHQPARTQTQYNGSGGMTPGAGAPGAGNRPGYAPAPGQYPGQTKPGYTPPPPSASHPRPAPSAPRAAPAPAPRAAPPPPAAPRPASPKK
ncbi:FecR family protein [Terracidiphilus gabretensis]|jgi:hypothetical protein|uniref:FecR family protein n=1 Tax=Terracidiphilus gabretensis TaxID=1577687 RepID=UPI00071B124F|nr:FecR family protein [Terracidiphilus gabretensis]